MSLVKFGKLPEAVVASMTLEDLVGSVPTALERAAIMKDLKVCGHALQRRLVLMRGNRGNPKRSKPMSRVNSLNA